MLFKDYQIGLYSEWSRSLHIGKNYLAEVEIRYQLNRTKAFSGMGNFGMSRPRVRDPLPSDGHWSFRHTPMLVAYGQGCYPTMSYARFQVWNGHDDFIEDAA